MGTRMIEGVPCYQPCIRKQKITEPAAATTAITITRHILKKTKKQ